MRDALLRAFLVIGDISAACAWTWPGVFPKADPVAVLVRDHTPNVYAAVVAWYDVAPGVAVFLTGQFLISPSRIWCARMGVSFGLRSRLPAWPLSPTADGPAIVVGEVHPPVRAIEIPTPEWLTIPERGLSTGVAMFGAVGSGKTSACLHPFARQFLSWHADNPERRPAALVLEVKGDLCHDIRRILAEVGREGDYIELSLDGRLPWNPLRATWLDSYSLASPVASQWNHLFGKGNDGWATGVPPPRSAWSPTPGNVKVYNSKPRRADDHRRTRRRDEGRARCKRPPPNSRRRSRCSRPRPGGSPNSCHAWTTASRGWPTPRTGSAGRWRRSSTASANPDGVPDQEPPA